MKLNYYFVNTTIGNLTIIEKDETVIYIALPNIKFKIITNWCDNQFNDYQLKLIKKSGTNLKIQFKEYFAKERTKFDIKYKLFTTNFRMKTLNEVCKIPYGFTMSYSEIAKNIGNPKAVRAVGSANATNTLPIIIPCHRVIAQNGGLGGYGGGLDMKIKLLELEGWNK